MSEEYKFQTIMRKCSPHMDHSENFELILSELEKSILISDKPVIEVGTNLGGSALSFLFVLNKNKKNNWLYTVDPYGNLLYSDGTEFKKENSVYGNDRYRKAQRLLSSYACKNNLNHHHFKVKSKDFISSVYSNFLEYKDGACEKLTTFSFVFLDGSHDIEDVCEEIAFFSERLEKGCSMVVDDVTTRTNAIREFFEKPKYKNWHKRFEISVLGGQCRIRVVRK